jgi:hypothetical protein
VFSFAELLKNINIKQALTKEHYSTMIFIVMELFFTIVSDEEKLWSCDLDNNEGL